MIDIYTDGACIGNPGPGGWAAIILKDGAKLALHGGENKTTNNRMEMLAVIKGLESLPQDIDATVYSDSQYVIRTMTRNWKRNANKELWAKLDLEVGRRRVKWQWVRGHAGNQLNEEADALAYQEATMRTHNRLGLNHIDESGKAHMVDVGGKPNTERVAVARGSVVMRNDTLAMIEANDLDKGNVFGVARLAGILGAKATPHLIPLCHSIPLSHVMVEFEIVAKRQAIDITATAKTTSGTGVEMEAMTAVSVAALTIYDMCKAVDKGMRIEAVRLLKKRGGKSGDVTLEDDEG